MRHWRRDRWIVTLYPKQFDLGKTRSATTDYVIWKATVDICNRIDCVIHDWHCLLDKQAIFIRRCCVFFCSAKSLFFHRCKIFVAGLVNVSSIYENANDNVNRQCYYKGGVIIMSIAVLKDYFFHKTKVVRLEKRESCSCFEFSWHNPKH